MKRQADSQCIEQDKRNKTGTDDGNPGTAPLYGQSSAQMTNPYIGWNASLCNPQMYSRPSSSQQGPIGSHHTYGHVPIYDPIRAQMNTSNNGRNTSAFTQQMYPHPSMLQGALGASYPHYREEHFNPAGVFAVGHRAHQTGRAQAENLDATAYNRQAMMQPTTSYQPWAQFREQQFNPAFNPVFAVGNRSYHSGRAQAENLDATAHSRQTMMQLPTHHHAGTQFRLGSGDQLQRSTNDLRYTPMHVGHYVNDSSLVHQQMHPHPSMLQRALGAGYPHYNAIAYNQQLMMQRTLPYHFGTQFGEEHFNPAGVSAVGHRAYQTGRAQAENSDATAYNRQMLSQPSTIHHAETQFRSGSSNQLQRSTNDLRCTSMHSEHYANDSSPVHQQTPAQPSTSQLGQTASNQNSGEQHTGPLQDSSIEKGLHQTNKEKAGSGTVVNVHHADKVYHVMGGTVDNRQMLPQPSTSETEQNAATSRTIASCHEALHKLREILKDYDSRECNGRVTEDYDELTEPTEEVNPKILLLLKFYRGDLLKKMLQYQKDPAFKYKSKAASSGKKMDYKTFLRRIMETETKRISLIAQAGSGKTVMLKRLARDLAKHNDELLIFFMNFRDFKDSKEITPRDFLINGRLPDSDAKHSYEWILENQDKVMLVLDGLDQATWDIDKDAAVGPYGIGKVSEIVSSLFKRKLFPGVKVVYSSREHAVASLEGELRPEMVFALIGLSPGDSEWLFKSFLQEDGKILWEKLRTQSHSLIPLLSIPAFLVFTAIVYVNKPENPPRSMTEVLKNLLEIFMRSGHIVEKEIPVVMKGLKKMSFCGMKDGKVSFLIIDVRNSGLDPQKIRDWIIRIPGLNQRNQFLLEGDYVLIFSHQIIQEFLAAQYIIEEDIKSFEKIVNQYLKKSSWSVVARFVSGLLLNDEISADLDKDPDIELKKTALKKMLKKKFEGLKISSPDLLATISESNCNGFIRDSLQEKKLDVRRLGDSDAYIIGSAMRHLTCLNELRFQSCGLRHEPLQILWNLIENSSLKISKLNFSDIELDTGTFVIIGNIVQRCSVEELTVRDCKLAGGSLTIVRFTVTKTSRLYLRDTELKDIGYAALGKIVKTCAVDQLELESCDLTDGKLKNLMIEVEGAKISKIDISRNSDIEDEGYATLGKIVKMCAVDQLWLRDCELSDGKLKNLLSKMDGAKISKLDVSRDTLNEDAAAVLGDIVKRCSVEDLTMQDCQLNDGSLKTLLSRCSGAKISKLDVSENTLHEGTAAVLGDIVKRCSVEELNMQFCHLNDGSLKTLLSRSSGAKISKLHVSHNPLNEDAAAVLGDIVKRCSVEELLMKDCWRNDGSLKSLLSRCSGAKISKLDVSHNALNEGTAAVLGDIVKRCSVEELTMENCRLNDGLLNTLLSRSSGAKISKLDVSRNTLNEDTAVVLGDIVQRCSVEYLTMHECGLSDVSLKTLLSRCSGAKLSFIDVKSYIPHLSGKPNDLSSALLDEISRSITVKRD